jgi:hypothetical protein
MGVRVRTAMSYFAEQGSAKFPQVLDRLCVTHQRFLEIAIGGCFVTYAFYVLTLGKLFAPPKSPDWYRDLGILWDLADYTVQHEAYPPGYFFPPSNAILAHLYGLINRDLAFRLYLIVQVVAVAVAMWAWAHMIRLTTRPSRSLVMLTAFLAVFVYIRAELGIHNTNAMTFCLVSIALVSQGRRQFSAGCYTLSIAIKPYGSVFVLPWMAWNGYRDWTASALVWLLGFYIVLPVAWFGAFHTPDLYREWFFNVTAAASSDDTHQLSVQGGVAALAGAWPAARVYWVSVALQAGWLGALIAFFVPTALRRGAPSAMAFACEAAAILLIFLPLGGLRQPGRSITVLASTLIIGSAVFDLCQAPILRVALAAILATIGSSLYVVGIYGPMFFFLLTLPVCLLALMGLAIVRAMPPKRELASTERDISVANH